MARKPSADTVSKKAGAGKRAAAKAASRVRANEAAAPEPKQTEALGGVANEKRSARPRAPIPKPQPIRYELGRLIDSEEALAEASFDRAHVLVPMELHTAAALPVYQVEGSLTT